MESNCNVKFERRFVNDNNEKGRCLFSDILYAGTEEYYEQIRNASPRPLQTWHFPNMKLNTITFRAT